MEKGKTQTKKNNGALHKKMLFALMILCLTTLTMTGQEIRNGAPKGANALPFNDYYLDKQW